MIAPLAPQSPYRWLLLAGIVLGALGWWRLGRRDPRLRWIYGCALLGAFLGAKVVYLLAEGWQHLGQPDAWLPLLTGKSVLGALPGGYAGVEFAKSRLGYRERTGDLFAAFAPAGIALGRVGCVLQGCCLGERCERPAWWTLADADGRARWPAAPVELVFNVAMLVLFWVLRRRKLLTGQHFHLYLIGYGLFRFVHESHRETPRVLGPLSGYALIALSVFAFGALAYALRASSVNSLRVTRA